MTTIQPIEIGVVLYPSAQQAAVLGVTDLLLMAGGIAAEHAGLEHNPVRVTHWQASSEKTPPVRVFDSSPDLPCELAIVIVPPKLGDPIDPHRVASTVTWLQGVHANGGILASVCAGTFVLAETGLLNQRTVTAHWALAESFEARFPDIGVDTDQLLIDDVDIITSSGLMSWTDLGLRLVERFLGPNVMLQTAQVLLIDVPGREQRYYSMFAPRLAHGDTAILKVQHWLQTVEGKDVSLAQLAVLANLEERTFLRRFQKATGMTSSEYCQQLRVSKARSALQLGHLSVERVAWAVGYSDPSAFRKVFTRIVGLSPSEYRSRFKPQPA